MDARHFNDVRVHIIKGGDPDETITVKTVRDLLKELNLETEFEPKDILKVWRK